MHTHAHGCVCSPSAFALPRQKPTSIPTMSPPPKRPKVQGTWVAKDMVRAVEGMLPRTRCASQPGRWRKPERRRKVQEASPADTPSVVDAATCSAAPASAVVDAATCSTPHTPSSDFHTLPRSASPEATPRRRGRRPSNWPPPHHTNKWQSLTAAVEGRPRNNGGSSIYLEKSCSKGDNKYVVWKCRGASCSFRAYGRNTPQRLLKFRNVHEKYVLEEWDHTCDMQHDLQHEQHAQLGGPSPGDTPGAAAEELDERELHEQLVGMCPTRVDMLEALTTDTSQTMPAASEAMLLRRGKRRGPQRSGTHACTLSYTPERTSAQRHCIFFYFFPHTRPHSCSGIHNRRLHPPSPCKISPFVKGNAVPGGEENACCLEGLAECVHHPHRIPSCACPKGTDDCGSHRAMEAEIGGSHTRE